MSESLGEAVLELSTDSTRLNSGMRRAETGVREGIGRMGHAVRGLGVSMGLLALPLIEAGREGGKKLGEMQLASEQTTAVLKSTGNAAHVSAAQIHEMSERLGDIAGVAPDAVEAGENMLLTFRNVQDRAGKGNNIFHQATKTMMDFATAMHMGPTSASLALGKALNDPEKGMSRLQRMGVTFTDSQKKAAAAMEDSGNIAGAQKIVLGELNKEFGGSAAAAGKTFPAAMNRLKDTFAVTAALVIQQLLPTLQTLFGHINDGLHWVQHLSPAMQHLAGMIGLVAMIGGPVLMVLGEMLVGLEGLLGVVAVIASPIGLVVAGLALLGAQWLRTGNHMAEFKATMQKIATWIQNVAWPAILHGAQAAMKWYQANIVPTIKAVVSNVTQTLQQWGAWIRAFWQKWGDDIMRVVKPAFEQLKVYIAAAVKVVGSVIDAAMALMRGDWGDAWSSLKDAAHAALTGVVAMLKGAAPLLLTAGRIWIQMLAKGALATLKALPGLLVGATRAYVTMYVTQLIPFVFSTAQGIGKALIDGIIQGIDSSAGALYSKMQDISNKLLKVTHLANLIKSPSRLYRDSVGRPIMDGIALGLTQGLPGVLAAQGKALDALHAASDASIESAKDKAAQAKSALDDAGSLTDAQAALKQADKTAYSRVLTARVAVRDAQKALGEARKSKNSLDIAAAKLAVKEASNALSVEKHATAAARAHLGVVQKLNAAWLLAQKQAKATQAAAEKAEKDAQDALDRAQEKQDALAAGLAAITDAASLATNSDDLNDALNGDPTVAGLQQRITDLKTEYASLQEYLKANAQDLSVSAQADIVGTMASVMGAVNDASSQVNDILNPKSADGTSTSGSAAGASAGGDTGARLTVVQQFSSEPDMFAASRSALFAYQTAGLVAG